MKDKMTALADSWPYIAVRDRLQALMKSDGVLRGQLAQDTVSVELRGDYSDAFSVEFGAGDRSLSKTVTLRADARRLRQHLLGLVDEGLLFYSGGIHIDGSPEQVLSVFRRLRTYRRQFRADEFARANASRKGVQHAPNFVSSEETGRIVESIHSLKKEWSWLQENVVAYLGSPYWLLRDRQPSSIARTNPILREHFSWLYERISGYIEQTFEAPAELSDSRALPGFHLVFANEAGKDIQFGLLHWDYRTFQTMPVWNGRIPDAIEEAKSLSWTLPIVLPKAGGGLMTWPTSSPAEFEDYTALLGAERAAACYIGAAHEAVLEKYEVGELITHSGQILHSPATIENPIVGDQRITLQGHAFLIDGKWRIFW